MDCCYCVENEPPKNKSSCNKAKKPWSPPPLPCLLPSAPGVEYRVTTDVRHKDNHQPEVVWVQSHTALQPEELAKWYCRKITKQGTPWIGDGTYEERRDQRLHHFGITTLDFIPMEQWPANVFHRYNIILGDRPQFGECPPNKISSTTARDKLKQAFLCNNPCPNTWHTTPDCQYPGNQLKSSNGSPPYNGNRKKVVVCMPCPEKAAKNNYSPCHEKVAKNDYTPYHEKAAKNDCSSCPEKAARNDCPPCPGAPHNSPRKEGCGRSTGNGYPNTSPPCHPPITSTNCPFLKLLPAHPCCPGQKKLMELCQKQQPAGDGCPGRKEEHHPRQAECAPCSGDGDGYQIAKDYRSYKLHSKPRQTDYLYRCESRELLGSKLLKYCLCVRRNGLQDECPRTPCRGRPACLVRPWPNCWPSGGCHGIDYERQNGIERVNPTLQYRMDDKECGPCDD